MIFNVCKMPITCGLTCKLLNTIQSLYFIGHVDKFFLIILGLLIARYILSHEWSALYMYLWTVKDPYLSCAENICREQFPLVWEGKGVELPWHKKIGWIQSM